MVFFTVPLFPFALQILHAFWQTSMMASRQMWCQPLSLLLLESILFNQYLPDLQSRHEFQKTLIHLSVTSCGRIYKLYWQKLFNAQKYRYLLPVVIVFFSYTEKKSPVLLRSEVLMPSLWDYDPFMWNSEDKA